MLCNHDYYVSMDVISPSNNIDVIKNKLTDFTQLVGLGQFEKGVLFLRIDIYFSKRLIILASLKYPTKMTITHRKKHVYHWREKESPYLHKQVDQNNFCPVPDDVIYWTSLKFFKQLWNDEITDVLVNQTNLYNVHKTGSSISTSHDEIEQLIGIQMLMFVVKMP